MDIEIAELVERFDRGDIRLPLMQRDYVWRAKKVEDFLILFTESGPLDLSMSGKQNLPMQQSLHSVERR